VPLTATPSPAGERSRVLDESHVRELFTPYAIDLDFHRGASPIQFPSAEDYMSFMETNYGPTISARARLLAEGQWETCRAEIIDLMKRLNTATDGITVGTDKNSAWSGLSRTTAPATSGLFLD
jgi:hypothetical protein